MEGRSQREDAVLAITDVHWGKKTPTFDMDVCKQRFDRAGERLKRLRDLQSDYEIERLHIALLGDLNDGTMIYATQPYHQAQSNVERQADEVSDFLAEWIVKQMPIWGAVDMTAIPGNHGHTGKLGHEAANWDIVSYRYLKLKIANAVKVDIADVPMIIESEGDASTFIKKATWRGHSYLLYHGHDIRSYAGIPWYGMMNRLIKWQTTRALGGFDVAMMGHFHSWGDWQINTFRMIESGTMVSDDEWALRLFGWESTNRWHLYGVSDSRPVTWQYGLDLL
jgi:hypothetical protein